MPQFIIFVNNIYNLDFNSIHFLDNFVFLKIFLIFFKIPIDKKFDSPYNVLQG